jgi:hypothetical protein
MRDRIKKLERQLADAHQKNRDLLNKISEMESFIEKIGANTYPVEDPIKGAVYVDPAIVKAVGRERLSEISNPAHYTFSKIEVLDAIEEWKLNFRLGNVIKYVARADHKGSRLTDLEKALFYLSREIKKAKDEP